MVNAVTARVLEAAGPAFVDAAGPLLPALVDALTGELDTTDRLLTVPAGPLAAAPLADLATSPYPAWLGQLAGVRVPAGLTLDAARAHVAGRGVSRRGTATAVRAAAAGTLTGTQRVDLFERDGSPWRLRVRTYTAQTADPAATAAAVLTEKPVGIVLTTEVRLGLSLGQLAVTGQTLGQLRSRTWDQIRRTVPS